MYKDRIGELRNSEILAKDYSKEKKQKDHTNSVIKIMIQIRNNGVISIRVIMCMSWLSPLIYEIIRIMPCITCQLTKKLWIFYHLFLFNIQFTNSNC